MIIKQNLEQVKNIIDLIEKDLQTRKSVKTALSDNVSPKKGYEIVNIRILPRLAIVTVAMLNRTVDDNDVVRDGDTAVFKIIRNQVYDEDEWNSML